ncbi:MAG: hypothetical protein KAS32_23855 [Candidatus Peribacteraceae bacterium]|nr:hypothetical protein [Candidatus Peribacteraceae bacterium]
MKDTPINIKVQPRRFLIDIDEHQAIDIYRALYEYNKHPSYAHTLKEDLKDALGYAPDPD